MLETSDDIARLQALLDSSYERAGAHLTAIHTPNARLSAIDLVARMKDMQIFVVATVTADGRPRTGPVDSFLYRGQVRFGTSSSAVRARHLARTPAISATHVQGETVVVTVHGTARQLDMEGADADFAAFLADHYGTQQYESFLAGNPYYTIEADWLFAADMSVHTQAAAG